MSDKDKLAETAEYYATQLTGRRSCPDHVGVGVGGSGAIVLWLPGPGTGIDLAERTLDLAYRHCVGLVRVGKVAGGVFASGPGLG